MVKFLLFAIVTISTFGLGSWAYKINYESRAASQRVKSLEKAILSAKSSCLSAIKKNISRFEGNYPLKKIE